MFNNRRYRLLFIIIITAFYILRIAGSDASSIPLKFRADKPVQKASFILWDSHGNYSIDLDQASRKIWVYKNTTTLPRNFNTGSIISFVLVVFAIILIVIDKNKRIKELCVMRFNGTKYKGGHSLPIF